MKRLSFLLLCLGFICSSLAQEQSDAQFPGGDKALMQFFRDSKEYTASFKSKKDFNVVVEVLIQEDGTAVFHKAVKPSNTKERVLRQVKRLIKSMPQWEPATGTDQDGKPVAIKSFVELTIPFYHNYYLGEGKTVVKVKEAGTLDKVLTQEQKDTCSYLEIKGKLNSQDILTLRRMSGGDGGHGRLSKLEMMDARIVSDDTPYLVLEDAESELVVDLCYVSTYSSEKASKAWGSRNSLWQKSSFPVPQFQLNEEKRENRMGPSWKGIKKYKIQHFKGHRLQKEKDGTYTYIAHTSRNNYCHDMFFRCPQIQTVVLPYGTRPQKHVQVIGHKVRCRY